MKTIIIFLLIAFATVKGYSCEPFNCSDFDYYNRDTILVIQYKFYYDSATNTKVKVVDKIVGHLTDVKDISKVDTVLTPRYKIHLSDKDSQRLENLILCCIGWLLETNYYSDKQAWINVEEFVLSSHSVSVSVDDRIIRKLESETGQNDLILRYYQLGIIKHIILKNYEPDNNQIQLAGLLSLNQFYVTSPKKENMPQILNKFNKKQDEEILLGWIKEGKE